MSLWLARHARPLVAPGTCYGALDLPANATLTQQAAQALHAALPLDVDVWVSPRMRCQQLAQALQTVRPGLHWRTDARLREMDFGTWEGVPWTDFAQHRFGGTESASEVLARVASAWDEAARTGHMLWITHAGVAQAACLLQQGQRHIANAADWPLSPLPYGAWMLF